MRQAIQIIAKGPRADAQAAAAALDGHPVLGSAAYSIIEEDEATGAWRIDLYPTAPGEAEATLELLGGFAELSVATTPLGDADWLAMSLSGLPPVRAGRFVVYGAHDAARVPPNLTGLRVEAGAAFGTGHHGTTLGCLVAFDALLKARRFARVLDVGTGTGVLAIAAALTGSRRVVGTDIDPVSVRIARENARLNAAVASFVLADGLAHARVAAAAPFDLVFANILARPLVQLAPAIRKAVARDGLVILSGLLRSQERAVRAAYLGQGFRLAWRLHRDAWATLVLARAG